MKYIRVLSLALLLTPHFFASAQNLEFSGAWVHISGDDGLNGFDVGTAFWFSRRVSLAFDYDSGWNTSSLGVFALTRVGLISTHSHIDDWLIGPRIHFPFPKGKNAPIAPECNCTPGKKYIERLRPFVEAQFGASHLGETVDQPSTGLSESATDNAFTWMLGAGADYHINPHWDARAKFDLLRTHFADSGQSRFRFALGVAYTIGARQ
jgi:opacity protein-like surface antigen